MSTPILNRNFEHPDDGWYQIEAKGLHPNARAKIVQVIDDKAIKSIATNFNSSAKAGALRHGREMLIDHEHFKHDEEKETIAYGWMAESQGREDGIYARNRWTKTGQPAVDGGDYRFFSTEYDHNDPENYETVPPSEIPPAIRNKYKDWKFIRPLVLTGLTLTNQFNNRGQKPITNRNTLPDNPADSPTGEQVDIQNKIKMKSIATRLGLSPDASEEALLGELGKIFNRATTAEGQIKPLTDENVILKNRVGELLGEQIDADLDGHGIKDEAIRGKLKPVLTGMKNREERVEFLGLMNKGGGGKEVKKPLTNRGGAQTPDGSAPKAADEESEKAKALKIKNRAQELKGAAPARDFGQCWNQARTEVEAGTVK